MTFRSDFPRSGTAGGVGTAIVTGASSGIGEQVALLLARRGYRLVLMARREDRLEELARTISEASGPGSPGAEVVAVDLSLPEALTKAVGRLVAAGESPPVEVLVNNAGYGLYLPFLEHSSDDFRRLMEVHYFAAVSAIRAVLPGMLERGKGHVINVASISTKVGPWGHAGYAASKSALATLTQTLAAEYGPQGIRFSCVNPGVVETEYFLAPSYEPLLPRVRRHAISAGHAAGKIVSLLDRPRLELCIPAHYRIMDWIKALSPTLAHLLVSWQSRPVGGPAQVPGPPRPAELPLPAEVSQPQEETS